MEQNFESKPRKKNRAVIIRCDDEAFMDLLVFIRSDPKWYVIYSKSSGLKLVVKEEAF